MRLNFYLIIFTLLLPLSCNKIEYDTDSPIIGRSTLVLMHRGCGYNNNFVPNTLPAAEYGLSVLDGVELDVQISKDGTLWLNYDNDVMDCNGEIIGCFQNMSDTEIYDVAICDSTIKYSTLESVFELMSTSYPNSHVSLDVKKQYCNFLTVPSSMKEMAIAVKSLVSKYDMENKVLVESRSIAFHKEMEDQEDIIQCIISLGDVDKGIADARAKKTKGISIRYGIEEINAEVVSLIHKKGYQLAIWDVNVAEDIEAVWASNPDYIQTDNADFKSYIP